MHTTLKVKQLQFYNHIFNTYNQKYLNNILKQIMDPV